MPYLDTEPDREQLARVARLCELHRRVALQEMINHEFLNEGKTLQRTTFADGTTITADVRTGKWESRGA